VYFQLGQLRNFPPSSLRAFTTNFAPQLRQAMFDSVPSGGPDAWTLLILTDLRLVRFRGFFFSFLQFRQFLP